MGQRVLLSCLLLLAPMCAPVPARAHDLWLKREGSEYVLRSGHLEADHAGDNVVAYSPDILREAICVSPDGQGQPIRTVSRTQPIRLTADCAAVYVLTSTGYWTKTPYGTTNVPKTQSRQPIKSWLSIEAVKRIDAWSPAMATPATRHFEVTPLADPLGIHTDHKLDVLITLDGKPVRGAAVAYGEETRAETDRDGKARIKIRHGGLQLIRASIALPSGSSEADETVHACTLVFELPE